MNSRTRRLILFVAWISFPAVGSIAQVTTPPASANKSMGGKTPKFDVVSIRPIKPGTPGGSFTTDVLPDGYRARGQSLYSTIMVAYSNQGWMFWSTDRLQGAPAWVMNEFYDIDAKVAPEDLAEWQRQGNTPAHREMLHAMLQAALADRCKLVLHRIPAETPGYALTVGKRGPKLKEATPDETLPAGGMALPDGGEMVNSKGTQMTFFNVSMASFNSVLTMMSRGPMGVPLIADNTGLTGKYDFVLRRRDTTNDSANDPASANVWDLEDIGLELKPAKLPAETLVIDHIERPSEN